MADVNVLIGGIPQENIPFQYKSKALKYGLSFAEQVNESNTKYIIKYDFSLGGDNVELPDNCILAFDGGSIFNGNIACQDVFIEGQKGCLKNITFTEDSTCINNTFYIDWFDIDTTANVLDDDGYLDSGSTVVLCTKEIQGAFNLKVPNIVFGKGRYSFNCVEIRDNCRIVGEKDTVLIARPREVGKKPTDALLHAVNIDKVEVRGMTFTCYNTMLDEYPGTNSSKGLLYFDTVENVIIDNILISRAYVGWGENRGEYYSNAALILCDDCHFTRITNSEFFDSYGSERIYIVHTSKTKDDVNIYFRDNYYHDDPESPVHGGSQKGNSTITAFANHVVVENNIFEDYTVDMSLCNLLGNYVFINNNVVRNCTASSVFDTSEYGQSQNISVTASNNVIDCKNGICFITYSDNVTIINNHVKALALITETPTPKAGNFIYSVCNNVIDATNYVADYTKYPDFGLHAPAYSSPICILSSTEVVNTLLISIISNTIKFNGNQSDTIPSDWKLISPIKLYNHYAPQTKIVIKENTIVGNLNRYRQGSYVYGMYFIFNNNSSVQGVTKYNNYELITKDNSITDTQGRTVIEPFISRGDYVEVGKITTGGTNVFRPNFGVFVDTFENLGNTRIIYSGHEPLVHIGNFSRTSGHVKFAAILPYSIIMSDDGQLYANFSTYRGFVENLKYPDDNGSAVSAGDVVNYSNTAIQLVSGSATLSTSLASLFAELYSADYGAYVISDGNVWRKGGTYTSGVYNITSRISNYSSTRPELKRASDRGICIFNSDSNVMKPIWWTGDTTGGKSGWVNADGEDVPNPT